MPDSTLEEATRCPRCENPGRWDSSKAGNDGAIIRTYVCENERCKWYQNGSWIVQVNANGTIPQRKKGEKDFDISADTMRKAGERYIEQTMRDERMGEIDNPYAR